MRLVGMVLALAGGAFLACSTASVGSYGNGEPLPDRDGGDDTTTATNGTATTSSSTTATLTVTLAGTGTGTVTSAPSGIACSGTTCTGTFKIGTSVSLAAAPTGGSAFAGWTGACTGPNCTLTLSANATTTATFSGLGGTWSGPYEHKERANNCDFDNKGTLTVALAATDGGTTIPSTANADGFQLRRGDCSLSDGNAKGQANSDLTLTGGTLAGTWNFAISGASGKLPLPFTATVSGATMTGTWTCTGCTGTFTLTKQ